jgi:threonine/homoserine/homoserine lactone efflux protein
LLPGFLLTVALVELTPGPNMGYLTLVGTRWGRRAGLATVAGITCGLTIYMLAAVAGLGAVLLRIGWLYAVLRWAGVGYLLWLALETWRGDTETSPGHRPEPPTRERLFTRGLVANLLNPKAAIFYIALLPGFTNPAWGNLTTQAMTLGLVHIGVSVAVHGSIVLAAGSASTGIARWASSAGRRSLDRSLAGGLVIIAIWLAWETFRSP